MSPRLNFTKWLWCALVAIGGGPLWSPARAVAVRGPPNVPATVEAQAKFFQDFFSVQLSPYKIEFGHVCEDPNTWEQRYEKKDFKNHRDMGKVRWGDKKGGYGEHYWDLNHAGHAGNHGNDDYNGDDDHSYHSDDSPFESNSSPYKSDDRSDDDSSYQSAPYKSEESSYRVHDPDSAEDTYEEPSEKSTKYTHYDPQNPQTLDEINRAKRRAHIKLRADRENAHKTEEKEHREIKESPIEETETVRKPQRFRKRKQQVTAASNVEPVETEEVQKTTAKPIQVQDEYEEEQDDLNTNTPEQDTEYQKPTNHNQPQVRQGQTHYVPYEGGAGVRQHQFPPQPQLTPAASVPRLFLEPSTGHVVDRATGQAYILQPIVFPNIYNYNNQ